MGSVNYLIDTNVFINLEDGREVNPEFSEFLRLAMKHDVNVYVHAAAYDDIGRDRNEKRRKISLSKLKKFPSISKVRDLSAEELENKYGPLNRPNDLVDATLLNALQIGAADFLVTEDVGLHRRAQKYASNERGRVLYVSDAVSLLRSAFEPVEVPLRFVEEVDANTIPSSDSIFESLREDYGGFDAWWLKCVREQRKCWIVSDTDGIAGLIIRNQESASEADCLNKEGKILKLCTFKVRPEKRGIKLGELLLKQALWFAQANNYSTIYLTTFDAQRSLIDLITYYGFEKTLTLKNGELVFERQLSTEALGDVSCNYEAARLNYPRFAWKRGDPAFIIPIQEAFHDILFPELHDTLQPGLFDPPTLGAGPARPGNTIRKVYLCRARLDLLPRGALIFFYKGKSSNSPSQSITTLGIVEEMRLAYSLSELRQIAGGRSVYSETQLANWKATQSNPVKAINFIYPGYFAPAVSLDELQDMNVFTGHPVQSIAKCREAAVEALLERLDLGFEVL